MSYQSERDSFIARMAREGLSLDATLVLLRCATSMQRYAELVCSSEAADRDRVPCPQARNAKDACLCDYTSDEHHDVPRIAVLDWRTEVRAEKVLPAGWTLDTQGDPRGYVLRVIPPSYAGRNQGKDRFNRDAIGVPARDSRIQW